MMHWITLNEILDARDKDDVKTVEIIVKVSSINTIKHQDRYGTPSSMVGLQNDSIWVIETRNEIMERCHGYEPVG